MTESEKTLSLIKQAIIDWYKKYDETGQGIIISDRIGSIRELNDHRDNIDEVIYDLATINTQMWYEQDGIRSENDQDLLKAIENIHPLNQHRNDLIEEIDEILLEQSPKNIHVFNANYILELIRSIIVNWHNNPEEYKDDEDELSSSLIKMVNNIAKINTIIWHEEDKVRERESNEIIIKSVRKMNYLNKERNILVEMIDESLLDITNGNDSNSL